MSTAPAPDPRQREPGTGPSADAAGLAGAAAVVAIFSAAVGILAIRSVDFFWHLAAGRWMLAHGALPRLDPFRFTSDAEPWVDHEWGFQLLLGLGEKLGGLPLLVLGRALLLVVLGLLVYRGMRRRGAPAAPAALLTVLAVAGLRSRLLFRPELATLLGTALLLTLLDAVRLRPGGEGRAPGRTPWGPIAALLVLVALWANLHPGVLAAPILVAAYAVGSLASRHPLPLWQVLGLPIAAAAAVTANPWGYHVYLVPGRIAAALEGLPATNPDWAPIWEKPQPLVFLALGGLALFVALTWARLGGGDAKGLPRLLRIDPAPAAVTAALLPLVASSARHQGLLWIAAAWLAGACLADLARAGRLDPAWRGRGALAAAALFAAAGLAWLLPAGGGAEASPWRPGHEIGLGVVPGLFPAAGVDALEAWANRGETQGAGVGPVFNSAPFGGYLLYRAYPPRQVFYDTRNEVDPDLLRQLARARSGAAAWDALLARYGIDGALLRYEGRTRRVVTPPASPGAAPLVEHRTSSALLFPAERFALVHWDDVSMLFLARTAEREKALAQAEYRFVQPEDWRHTLERAAADPEYRRGAVAELRRKLAEDPTCLRAAELLAALGA